MTEREYLLAATMAAKRYENADLIQQGVEVTVGSQKFYRADYADYKVADKGYKTFLCTAWKENIIAWTSVGRSQLQLDELVRSIRSASFSRTSH
jgi:hypothetical protein